MYDGSESIKMILNQEYCIQRPAKKLKGMDSLLCDIAHA